ncbi:heme-binding Shp domain-containing protein [Peptoniphilus asaccharolyticus]
MKKFLICVLVIFSLAFNSKVFAYQSEIGKATPYYSHPVTGVIEDAGNNPGIGQGMTENVLHQQAFLEEVDGVYFLTVRFNLASYIKNETFAVQNRGDSDFYSTAAEIVKSSADSKDYRFEVPSKNVIVRASFFVEPMGRDIVFYFDVSNFTKGNTDFVPMEETDFSQDENILETETHGESEIGSIQNNSSIENQQVVAAPKGEKIETKAVDSKLSSEGLGYSHGLLMKDSTELKKIIGAENKSDVEENKEKKPMGFITKAFIYTLLGIIALSTVVLISAAAISTVYLRKLKLDNDRMVEEDEE